MKRIISLVAAANLLATYLPGGLLAASPAGSTNLVYARNTSEDYSAEDLFKIVSASKMPVKQDLAPATVYVLTSAEIMSSGATNLPDALRMVPGVDVTATKTGQMDVSIRGLNKSLNQRTLVLLDGKPMAHGTYDTFFWDTLPVPLEEIDRVEVVAGPASALYGPNAVQGVINIITKTPEQMKGGQISYTGGERKTHLGSVLYGNRSGKFSYKASVSGLSENRFEKADLRASDGMKFHALMSYAPSDDSELSLSGGQTNINTNEGVSKFAQTYFFGPVGFGRLDYRFKNTKFRTFYNYGEQDHVDVTNNVHYDLPYGVSETSLEQSLSLAWNNDLTLGGSYRHVVARSNLFFKPTTFKENLWALFFEDRWQALDQWAVLGTGRVDKHPWTPATFSPRASIIYQPAENHTLRTSAGIAFRYPFVMENNMDLLQVFPNPGTPTVPNPPFTAVQVETIGNKALGTERVKTVELAYTGHFGKLKATLVGFHNTFNKIMDSAPAVIMAIPPTLNITNTFTNVDRTIIVFGGETGLEYGVTSWLQTFANYSYEEAKNTEIFTQWSLYTPRNKVNSGFHFNAGGWNGSLWMDWVGSVRGNQSPQGSAPVFVKIPDYTLLNIHLDYQFKGKLDGLMVGVSGFNIGNDKHYEATPGTGALTGDFAELIKSRWTGTISYKF